VNDALIKAFIYIFNLEFSGLRPREMSQKLEEFSKQQFNNDFVDKYQGPFDDEDISAKEITALKNECRTHGYTLKDVMMDIYQKAKFKDWIKQELFDNVYSGIDIWKYYLDNPAQRGGAASTARQLPPPPSPSPSPC
jgi:hypothetical protein